MAVGQLLFYCSGAVQFAIAHPMISHPHDPELVPAPAMSRRYEPSPLEFVADNVELYESTGGRMGNSLPGSGEEIVVLTTIGARSGAIRKTPVMRVVADGRWLLVGSMGGQPTDPHWCRNLRARPDEVWVQDGPEPQPVSVKELSGAERDRWWTIAVQAFPDYADYRRRTDRVIPLFLATPCARHETPHDPRPPDRNR